LPEVRKRSTMSHHHDDLEIRTPEAREAALFGAVPA